jgi:5-methylcytosine-specific restriction enzyme A
VSPAALLKPCAHPLCPELVESGYCPTHARAKERCRGSAASRGYGAAWRAFVARYREMLITQDIAPVCGASLPGGPAMTASRCRAEGRLEARTQVHHDPPLRDEERQDERAVCDPLRVGLLCVRCHSGETLGRQNGGGR